MPPMTIQDDRPFNPFPNLIPAHLTQQATPHCYCGHHAQFIARLHATDCCAGTTHLDPDGNHIALLCARCLHGVAQHITHDLATRIKRLHGAVLACRSCGRPLAALGDLLGTEAL